MNAFQFEIVTPDKVFYKAQAVSLIAPQMEGYFGVLANHAPLIARSAGGKLTVREKGSAERHFHLGPGIVEVLQNRVFFLTREAHETF